jgi:hypothetical protein
MLLAALAAASPVRADDVYVNAQVPWHSVRLDAQGRLLAWYRPEAGLGYDQVLRRGWNFIEHKVPLDTTFGTGERVYLVNSVFDARTLQPTYRQHNPAMVYAAFVDSLVGWYAYSGDREAIDAVRSMLDYQLAHGTTPDGWDWPGVPFATSCGREKDYGRCLEDLPHEFYGGIETDKVGELGTGYALFYELSGEKQYLAAAVRCADALARHVRAGDAEHTPWPFRVDARTGVTLALEEYGGDVAGSLRLFDELIRLGAGDAKAYRAARELALRWLLDYPLNHDSHAWNKWSGFFEDIPRNTEDVNQLTPMMAAYYILSRPDPAAADPRWMSHIGRLLDWVRIKFGRGPFFGAQAIDEQGTPDASFGCCSRAGQGDHTARWAAVNALFYARTHDGQAREDAFRSLNYATYFARDDGEIACCGVDYNDPYWWSDGYADYFRHFQWAMGAVPEFAPAHADHLLQSTSVVQAVSYAPRHVEYRTFDAAASEVLRVSFRPSKVTAGGAPLRSGAAPGEGYVLEALAGGDWVVRVRHERSASIVVSG